MQRLQHVELLRNDPIRFDHNMGRAKRRHLTVDVIVVVDLDHARLDPETVQQANDKPHRVAQPRRPRMRRMRRVRRMMGMVVIAMPALTDE
jgi:hypothetical protein